MKKILASALVALTLSACTPAEPVVTSTPSAYAEPVVTADSNAPVGFERESAAVVTAEPVAPVVPAEPVEVAPVEPVDAPVSVPEPVVATVEPKPVAEPVHWGHAVLAEHGLAANIVVVDAVSVCRIPGGSGGCAYPGSGTIMLSADMAQDWRGLHVLFHEYAHAVLGITDECEAEAYAHSMTGNVVWSYEECK